MPGPSDVVIITEDRITLESAEAAFSEGRYEDVLRVTRALEDLGEGTERSSALRRDAFMKMGELHRALGELGKLRGTAPRPTLDVQARRLLGRIIETDISWLPKVPALEVAPTRRERRVLHVLKESRPYVETGFTMRSQMTLSAQSICGYEPFVVTSLGFPRTKGIMDAPEREVVDGTSHFRLDLADIVNPLELPFDRSLRLQAPLIAEVAQKVEPALIQAGTGYRGYETALLAIAVADQRSIPMVYEVRGFQEQTWTSDGSRSERGEYFRRRWAQENRCMARADAVITIAQAMAEEIIARGIPEEKVSVVPNAVDTDRFKPRKRRPDLVDRYRLRDRFVLGYISNLGVREGIDVLIRAVGILRARKLDVSCLIVGDGPERQRLNDLVVDLDLIEYVTFTGHVSNDQIEDYYALIDLFVVPRLSDRASRLVTPLKPLEAMAMRLPVIASRLPALEELVAPGTRGMTFDPSNPAGLADTAQHLIDHSKTREQYAKAGHEWVNEHRTVKANADRYQRILDPHLR